MAFHYGSIQQQTEDKTLLPTANEAKATPSQGSRKTLFIVSSLVVLLLLSLSAHELFSKRSSQHARTLQSLLKELATEIQGDIFFPQDSRHYKDACRVWVQGTGTTPAAVIRVATEQDVAMVLPVLVSHAIPFCIRSGGHHKDGKSTCNGVMVSLQRLNTVQWLEMATEESAIVRIGPASTSRDIYETVIRETGYAGVIGFCGSVAESGFALGGGWGLLSRQYGLAHDNVVQFRVVLANGTVTDDNEDLDWALRGSGGGIGAVVTSMDYRVYKTSWKIVGSTITFQDPYSQGEFLQRIGELNPPGNLAAMHDTIGKVSLMWTGRTDEEVDVTGKQYLTKLTAEYNNVTEYHINWSDMYDWTPTTNDTASNWGLSVWKARCWTGFLMPENNTQDVWRTIMPIIHNHTSTTEFLTPEIELWGGAIANIPSNTSAFYYRQAVYNVGVLLMLPSEEYDAMYNEEVARVGAWWPQVAQYLQGSYVNYPMVGATPEMVWNKNLPRLAQIKQEFDPGDVFWNSVLSSAV